MRFLVVSQGNVCQLSAVVFTVLWRNVGLGFVNLCHRCLWGGLVLLVLMVLASLLPTKMLLLRNSSYYNVWTKTCWTQWVLEELYDDSGLTWGYVNVTHA